MSSPTRAAAVEAPFSRTPFCRPDMELRRSSISATCKADFSCSAATCSSNCFSPGASRCFGPGASRSFTSTSFASRCFCTASSSEATRASNIFSPSGSAEVSAAGRRGVSEAGRRGVFKGWEFGVRQGLEFDSSSTATRSNTSSNSSFVGAPFSNSLSRACTASSSAATRSNTRSNNSIFASAVSSKSVSRSSTVGGTIGRPFLFASPHLSRLPHSSMSTGTIACSVEAQSEQQYGRLSPCKLESQLVP
mmetsp:Transcript_69492/g.132601  ORF Transcript_69492/g.132601 Transcript_69492/m.132601 type:complete len:249 (-) Transcript_69492:2-748(-)